MIRFVLYLLVAYIAYRLFKSFVGSSHATREATENHTRQQETELIRDPQCGTYFLKQSGVKAEVEGKQVYFCCPSCRDAYLHESK